MILNSYLSFALIVHHLSATLEDIHVTSHALRSNISVDTNEPLSPHRLKLTDNLPWVTYNVSTVHDTTLHKTSLIYKLTFTVCTQMQSVTLKIVGIFSLLFLWSLSFTWNKDQIFLISTIDSSLSISLFQVSWQDFKLFLTERKRSAPPH